ALRADSSLWELLDSPLLLNIVALAYAGQAAMPARTSGSPVERRYRLFGLYVDQMLRRRATERRYTPQQTIHWLSWLAHEMADRGQTVFYPERLQLDLLPQRQQQSIRTWNRRIVALGFGLLTAVVVGLGLGLGAGLIGFGVGLIVTFYVPEIQTTALP